MKSVIVTFDEERVRNLEMDSEARPFAWMLRKGMLGEQYPAGRGVYSIKPMHVIPSTREKLGMD